jgi:hypothetical protein
MLCFVTVSHRMQESELIELYSEGAFQLDGVSLPGAFTCKRLVQTLCRRMGIPTPNLIRFEVFTAVTMKNGVFWVGSYKSHTA